MIFEKVSGPPHCVCVCVYVCVCVCVLIAWLQGTVLVCLALVSVRTDAEGEPLGCPQGFIYSGDAHTWHAAMHSHRHKCKHTHSHWQANTNLVNACIYIGPSDQCRVEYCQFFETDPRTYLPIVQTDFYTSICPLNTLFPPKKAALNLLEDECSWDVER